MTRHSIYSLPPASKSGRASWVKSAAILAGALILLGIVVMGVAGGSILSALSRGTHQLSIPGATRLKLKSGVYSGIQDPRSTAPVSGVFVGVSDDLTGQQIPVVAGPESAPAGMPLFQFQILDEGQYTLNGVGSGGDGNTRFLLVHESVARVRSDLLVGSVAGLLLIGAGVSLGVFIRRRLIIPQKNN